MIEFAGAEVLAESVPVDPDAVGELIDRGDFVEPLHAVNLIQTEQNLCHFFTSFAWYAHRLGHCEANYNFVAQPDWHTRAFDQAMVLLLHKNLCTKVSCMDKERDWFSEAIRRKVTVTEVANLLSVSRNTARTRLDEGLTSDEIITIARKLHVNSVKALVELGKIEDEEVFSYLDSDGTLLATATRDELIYQLAETALDNRSKLRLVQDFDELAARRSNTGDVDVAPGLYAANRRKLEPEEGDDGYGDGA